jgi:hypothetical protein
MTYNFDRVEKNEFNLCEIMSSRNNNYIFFRMFIEFVMCIYIIFLVINR